MLVDRKQAVGSTIVWRIHICRFDDESGPCSASGRCEVCKNSHPSILPFTTMRRIVAAGKAGGILTMNRAMQEACLEIGATFVATQIDVVLFANGMRNAAKTALGLLPDQCAWGTVMTENGGRYLQQLCKHWSHKAEATFDQTEGKVIFSNGQKVEMRAQADRLGVVVTAGPRADLAAWISVVEAHLKRFAFREDFEIAWSDAPPT